MRKRKRRETGAAWPAEKETQAGGRDEENEEAAEAERKEEEKLKE